MASQSLWAPNGNTVVSKKRGSKHIQFSVKQMSPLGVCVFSISLCVCVCLFLGTDVCLLLRGQGRVIQISVVCLLTQLHWNAQHHPHLYWAVVPHLCCGSDITAPPPHKQLLLAEDAALHKPLRSHSLNAYSCGVTTSDIKTCITSHTHFTLNPLRHGTFIFCSNIFWITDTQGGSLWACFSNYVFDLWPLSCLSDCETLLCPTGYRERPLWLAGGFPARADGNIQEMRKFPRMGC